MLKPHQVPTPLVTRRARPTITPLRRPHRFRPVMLASLWAGALLHLLWLRISGRATSESRALVIRRLLERLGGVWIKVGQLLGMRRDLFSAEFCDVLSALQDHATGFAFEYTRRAIEGELGGPIDRFFVEFEEAPFAAASIGQIHRARLRRGGTLVAVKIRRPYIARMVRGDIRFVEVLCRIAMRLHIFSFFRWDDFHHELERTLGEELDYRFEATNIRDMRRNLKDHGIYAPKVFTRLCSERVLVMEFITGALMSDVLRLRHVDPVRLQHWLAENGIEMKKVGRCLFESLMRQIFEDNYFHGDLHPGNIVLLRDSRIALIDFGSVGWLEADFLVQYDKMQDAMAHQQYAKASDLMLLLGPELPPIDLEPCKRELVAFMRAWALRARTPGMPYSEKSVGYALTNIARISSRYRVPAAWAFMRINRAQITLDASLNALYPEMDAFKEMRRASARSAKRRAKRAMSMENLGRQLGGLVGELPALVRDTAERGFYEVEWVRRRARMFQGSVNKFAVVGAMLANLFGFFALAAVAFGQLVYLRQQGYALPLSGAMLALLDEVPVMPPELWYAIGAFGLLTVIQVVRVRRRFRQPEVETTNGIRR